jgi:hypothetical protein
VEEDEKVKVKKLNGVENMPGGVKPIVKTEIAQ